MYAQTCVCWVVINHVYVDWLAFRVLLTAHQHHHQRQQQDRRFPEIDMQCQNGHVDHATHTDRSDLIEKKAYTRERLACNYLLRCADVEAEGAHAGNTCSDGTGGEQGSRQSHISCL